MTELKSKEELLKMSDDDILDYIDYIDQEEKKLAKLAKKDCDRESFLEEYVKLNTEKQEAKEILADRFDKYMRKAEEDWKEKNKPCPFCGGKVIKLGVPLLLEEYGAVEATCGGCGVTTPWFEDPNDAMEFWNTRD